MNTIDNNKYMNPNTYPTNVQKSAQMKDNSRTGKIYEEAPVQHRPEAEMTTQNAYEKMSAAMRTIPEEKQPAETISETTPESPSEAKELRVIECSIVSLDNGISFYFNDETGEVRCVDDNDPRPGRQVLWSRTLSKEELEKCDKLFENHADQETGGFVFRFQAYLGHEEFWDKYLEGRIDLEALKQEDDTHTISQ